MTAVESMPAAIKEPLINYLAVIPANAGIQRFQRHGFRPAPEWRI